MKMPAHPRRAAEYIGPGSPQSAEQPAGVFYRCAFYNIGWNSKDKQKHHSKENLATEISNLVCEKHVDAVGISEVFNLREENMSQERQAIMDHVLSKLNIINPSRAAQPAWKGRCDGHYIFVWDSNRLVLELAEYVSCGIDADAWRKAQYLKFHCADSQGQPPLHVCHNHSPSSKKSKLGRKNENRRKTIFKTLWDTVLAHDEGSQPVAIFGGDFNCNSVQWTQCLLHASATQASRRTVQECKSKPKPDHNGDRALVFNAFAFAEESHFGFSYHRHGEPQPFSDAHDVVLVPLCWGRPESMSSWIGSAAQWLRRFRRPAEPTRPARPTRPPPQPQEVEQSFEAAVAEQVERDASSSGAPPRTSSPVRPASLEPELELSDQSEQANQAEQPGQAEARTGSAEPPASREPELEAAPSLILASREATPRYNALLEKLTDAGDELAMERLADFCVHKDLKFKLSLIHI